MVLESVYTPKELAELLKVSEQVIADELKSGRLVGFKVGRQWRISEISVREYIKANTCKPIAEELDTD
ncbi:helix-turn-helix domain-containing protein [Sporomusa acidovorans]|uniref:Helix-turn-helix domain-containing protein n=1 Tax=Sporomusa acidovorans (strain ATCC 49682 / DSM 3132 / Mol) TaxID=1123286 RepID=A0ABZ3IXE5_SPOA4|nr:helix-turn-helix domain-containing protein [Sporomusa acidovorans]OZC23662.1 helix-turn-helix domain protein [Sporomusa acidovorans DSM 3132]SDE24269.1 DNA binding domain-containing protein, excisionase family [Sporomusa acidovorans]